MSLEGLLKMLLENIFINKKTLKISKKKSF